MSLERGTLISSLTTIRIYLIAKVRDIFKTYSSNTGVKISFSSFSSSSSDLVFASSSGVFGGSHEAMSLWLLASATLALLNIISASPGCAGMLKCFSENASKVSRLIGCGFLHHPGQNRISRYQLLGSLTSARPFIQPSFHLSKPQINRLSYRFC